MRFVLDMFETIRVKKKLNFVITAYYRIAIFLCTRHFHFLNPNKSNFFKIIQNIKVFRNPSFSERKK